MQAQGGGQIINVGWDQALTGGVGTESGQLFAASKAAVIGYSKALARGLAPDVRVNVVSPGWIETEWGETVNRELYERVRRQTPLARLGERRMMWLPRRCSWRPMKRRFSPAR